MNEQLEYSTRIAKAITRIRGIHEDMCEAAVARNLDKLDELALEVERLGDQMRTDILTLKIYKTQTPVEKS